MQHFNLDRKIARLILLQRTEITSPFLKRLRKFFGRYIFTSFLSRFLFFNTSISRRYYDLMFKEYNLLNLHLDLSNKKILSIGSGMCGLELLINSNSKNNFFTIIEKNYVSKKVKYGWDPMNNEAYNNNDLLKSFLIDNHMKEKNFEIFDFDKDKLPVKNYDYIISLYSLDYHYDFSIYMEYFKSIFTDKTKMVFDTIRPEYFKKIFEEVKIIQSEQKSIHSSKRIICNKLILD